VFIALLKGSLLLLVDSAFFAMNSVLASRRIPIVDSSSQSFVS